MKAKKIVSQKKNRRQPKIIYFIVTASFFLMTACAGTMPNSFQGSMNGSHTGNGTAQEVVSAYELHNILTEHFGSVRIKLSDVRYRLPDNSKLDQLRSLDSGNFSAGPGGREWGVDDYAIAAMVPMRNYAFGTMFIPDHQGHLQVMNVLVNRQREVVYWEPRARRYYPAQVDKPELILF